MGVSDGAAVRWEKRVVFRKVALLRSLGEPDPNQPGKKNSLVFPSLCAKQKEKMNLMRVHRYQSCLMFSLAKKNAAVQRNYVHNLKQKHTRTYPRLTHNSVNKIKKMPTPTPTPSHAHLPDRLLQPFLSPVFHLFGDVLLREHCGGSRRPNARASGVINSRAVVLCCVVWREGTHATTGIATDGQKNSW